MTTAGARGDSDDQNMEISVERTSQEQGREMKPPMLARRENEAPGVRRDLIEAWLIGMDGLAESHTMQSAVQLLRERRCRSVSPRHASFVFELATSICAAESLSVSRERETRDVQFGRVDVCRRKEWKRAGACAVRASRLLRKCNENRTRQKMWGEAANIFLILLRDSFGTLLDVYEKERGRRPRSSRGGGSGSALGVRARAGFVHEREHGYPPAVCTSSRV